MHRNFEKIDILTIYQFSCLDNYSSVTFKFFMTNSVYRVQMKDHQKEVRHYGTGGFFPYNFSRTLYASDVFKAKTHRKHINPDSTIHSS